MNKETLFEALSDVGDDLLVMAENKRFVSPWRKWGQTAAVLAVVVCLSALALPYFSGSCTQQAEPADRAAQTPLTMSAGVTADGAATEPQMEAEVIDHYSDDMEEAVEECAPEADAAAETMPQEAGAGIQRTKIVCRGTYFYLHHDVTVKGVPPLGEELGPITWSDDPSLVGRTVYTVPYSTWFDNFAVNGEPVTQEIYLQTPGGYYFGTTANEKVVSRYTMDDVRLAINKENHTWLTDTFALPIERQGVVDFTTPQELSTAELETMFWASTTMNVGVVVANVWSDGERYCVPMEDLLWRLDRVLDEGYVYDPTQSNWYDTQLGALVYPETKVKYDHRNLTLQDAQIADEDHLILTVGLPEGSVREYTIRFDKDAWRYERIVTVK